METFESTDKTHRPLSHVRKKSGKIAERRVTLSEGGIRYLLFFEKRYAVAVLFRGVGVRVALGESASFARRVFFALVRGAVTPLSVRDIVRDAMISEIFDK